MLRRSLALSLLVLLAWGGTVLRGGFAFDDLEAVRGNADQRTHLSWSEAFGRDYWEHMGPAGHWRPVAALSLRADRFVWGADTRGFHLTNLLVHLAVALLALALAERLGLPPPVAFAGAAVFALHPLLADVVGWISGRAGSLSALTGMLGALVVESGTRRARARATTVCAASFLGVFLALGAKEDGLVFGLVYLLLAARGGRRTLVAACLGVGLALGAWMGFRWSIYGSALPVAPHAPLANAPLGVRLAAGGRSLLELGRGLVFPLGISPTSRAAPGFGADAAPWPALLGWLPWLALAGGGAAALARGRGDQRLRAASALLAALSLLPVLQLVPAGELFAPRFAYLPLLLAVPLTGTLATRLLTRAPVTGDVPGELSRNAPGELSRSLPAVFALGLGILGCNLTGRAYASRGAWAETVLAAVPGDARAWNDLGVARDEDGDLAGAREAWRQAATLDPEYGRPWSNLGAALAREAERSESDSGQRSQLLAARVALERAVASGPGNPVARCNLGAVLLRLDAPGAAAQEYARATELAPGLVPAWRGLARARLRAGDASGARAALLRAAKLAPDDAGVLQLARELGSRP